MTSSVEDMLDPTFLLPQENLDILDEFLDQRVFELLNHSPQPGPTIGGEYLYDDPLTPSFVLSPQNEVKQEPVNELLLKDYEYIRDELTKLKFGNFHMNPCPPSVDVPDPLYIDFSPDTMANLPYKLSISELPTYSRVETQIKLQFTLLPAPPQMLLRIPHDLISKHKFCLGDPLDQLNPKLTDLMLHLDAYVLTLDLDRLCTICLRCIKREQKRALRRKAGFQDSGDDNAPGASSWSDPSMQKKALIFNCKELVSFPAPNGLDNESSKLLELSARIICYCRHHSESKGFKLLFVVRNNAGKVMAKLLSLPIMIMDRKKNPPSSKQDDVKVKLESQTPLMVNSSTNLMAMDVDSRALEVHTPVDLLPGLLPHSFDELELQLDLSHVLAINANHGDDHRRPLKRKKLSVDDSLNSATNPMFNGTTGLSPLLNLDTNTLTLQYLGLKPLPMGLSQSVASPTLPFIQRIIPAQGPIRGGIEVTLLGFNFHSGLAVKFGANQALATHVWLETTIVTYLPPAAQPGQVLVLFENQPPMMGGNQQQQVFTYTDDTDRQLIELALQIVGLKMNGKLEDAKNIARRIVGTDPLQLGAPLMGSLPTSYDQSGAQQWFDRAHEAVEQLVVNHRLSLVEEILINFLLLVDLPNCPIIIPNWQLPNKQGQTMIHLATLKGYTDLVKFLLNHGGRADIKDNQEITPLLLALMAGHRRLMKMFLERQCNLNLRLKNNRSLRDYCDPNVLDVFDEGKLNIVTKWGSVDSLSSMMTTSYGRHVLKMVSEPVGVQDPASDLLAPEYADLEFELDDSDYSDDERPQPVAETAAETVPPGLWQRVKNVFNNDDEEDLLPSYDDLFPFGSLLSLQKPKTEIERILNQEASPEDPGVTSDLSEDMVISYINHPRKSMENDKMLFFFWLPMLMIIVGVFFMVQIFGYKFELIENIKLVMRNSLGNMMVGSDRISRVFKETITG